MGGQSDFSALAAKAEAAREADRLDEALGLYRQAVALQPDWAEGWWFIGTILYDRDDYAGAAKALGQTVRLRPKDATPFLMLGLSEAKLGHREEALRDLGNGRTLGFTSDSDLARVVLFTEGTLWLEEGEFGKAQDDLDTLARHSDAQQELVVALGLAVLGLRPQDMASADAATHATVQQAGQAEYDAAHGDLEAAIKAYAELAANAPKFHNVQFACGRFLLAQHRDAEAVEAFRREIENTPNHLLARLGIAGIKLTDDPAGGLPYAQQAVQLAPRLAEAHFLLGATLLGLNQTTQAIAELETAAKLDPNVPKIYFQLRRAYARAGRREDAARANEAFIRLSKTAPP